MFQHDGFGVRQVGNFDRGGAELIFFLLVGFESRDVNLVTTVTSPWRLLGLQQHGAMDVGQTFRQRFTAEVKKQNVI